MAARGLLAALCLLAAAAPGRAGPLEEDLCAGSAAAPCAAPEAALGLLQTRAGEQRHRPARSTAASGGSEARARQAAGSSQQQELLDSLAAAGGLGQGLGAAAGGSQLPLPGVQKLLDMPLSPAVDCQREPWLCGPPLHCDTDPPKLSDAQRWMKQMASDGHANLKTWCTQPDYSGNLVKECIVNQDLKANAKVTYDFQVSRGMGEADGSYCFIEGYCNDEVVTYNTTLQEAEELCDERYPGWRSMGMQDLHMVRWVLDGTVDLRRGMKPNSSSVFAKLACAMGNYHCDVVYCRDTYCKQQHYIDRYGHWLS